MDIIHVAAACIMISFPVCPFITEEQQMFLLQISVQISFSVSILLEAKG